MDRKRQGSILDFYTKKKNKNVESTNQGDDDTENDEFHVSKINNTVENEPVDFEKETI